MILRWLACYEAAHSMRFYDETDHDFLRIKSAVNQGAGPLFPWVR